MEGGREWEIVEEGGALEMGVRLGWADGREDSGWGGVWEGDLGFVSHYIA